MPNVRSTLRHASKAFIYLFLNPLVLMSHKINIIKTFEPLLPRLRSDFSKLGRVEPVLLLLIFFLQRQGNFSKLTLN